MNILYVDFLNAVWRASIIFGAQNPDISDEHVLVYNFFRNLRPMVEMFSPNKMYFGLEGHPKFRYDLLPEYKGNRVHKQSDDKKDKFVASTNKILELCKFLPVTLVQAEEYEADDTIASLVRDDSVKEDKKTILTNDSDYLQLLQDDTENVQIYSPIKKKFMEVPEVPYVLWKSLNGDKSDNVPGIVKPAKALKMCKDQEMLGEFLAVEENRLLFARNFSLISFQDVAKSEMKEEIYSGDMEKLKEAFTELKFGSIVNDKSWKKYSETFDCLMT